MNRHSSENPTDHSGRELMTRLANGDDEQLAVLIEWHGQAVGQLLGRLTAWNGEEEDLMQSVFLRAWQKAGSYQGNGSLEGWLKRIAINSWRNHQQKKKSFQNKLWEWFRQRSGEIVSRAPQLDEPSPVQESLAMLPHTDRSILVLFYLEGMSGNRIAELLEIKPETVHVRLHRARQKLKPILLEQLNDEAAT